MDIDKNIIELKTENYIINIDLTKGIFSFEGKLYASSNV